MKSNTRLPKKKMPPSVLFSGEYDDFYEEIYVDIVSGSPSSQVRLSEVRAVAGRLSLSNPSL